MKTLRHPNVLLVKDVIEIESGNELTIHVVTEAVTPLEAHLREAPIGGGGTGRGMIIFRSGCGKSRRRWRS
jgi:SCY1-like protein 1